MPILWTLKPKDRPRTDGSVEALWESLGSDDAAAAYRLLWALSDDPKTALRLASERVHPAELVMERARFDRLLTALDGPRFAVREKAELELLRSGIAVPVAWLRQAYGHTKSEEVRARLGRVLAARQVSGPMQWRLERLAQCWNLLERRKRRNCCAQWASGPPDGFLTEIAAGRWHDVPIGINGLL